MRDGHTEFDKFLWPSVCSIGTFLNRHVQLANETFSYRVCCECE